MPLYCFCGNIPLWTQLRDCKRDGSDGTVEALAKIVPMIRKRFGKKVRVVVRADSGFAREAIMKFCEKQKLYYCFGLAKNVTIKALMKNTLDEMREQIEGGQLTVPCRKFVEFGYRTKKAGVDFGGWWAKRRFLSKGKIRVLW